MSDVMGPSESRTLTFIVVQNTQSRSHVSCLGLNLPNVALLKRETVWNSRPEQRPTWHLEMIPNQPNLNQMGAWKLARSGPTDAWYLAKRALRNWIQINVTLVAQAGTQFTPSKTYSRRTSKTMAVFPVQR